MIFEATCSESKILMSKWKSIYIVMANFTEFIRIDSWNEILKWIWTCRKHSWLLIHRLKLLLNFSIYQVANMTINLFTSLAFEIFLLFSCIRCHLWVYCLHLYLKRGDLLLNLLKSLKDWISLFECFYCAWLLA